MYGLRNNTFTDPKIHSYNVMFNAREMTAVQAHKFLTKLRVIAQKCKLSWILFMEDDVECRGPITTCPEGDANGLVTNGKLKPIF